MKRIKSLDHKDAIQRTVIASIHQPSAEVFQFFDNLCLFSAGKTVYIGLASAAIQFFASNGFPCPALQNPSDHILKIVLNEISSVTCIFLAAKVEETQVPLLLDLQVEDAKYVFESKTIQRMELLILAYDRAVIKFRGIDADINFNFMFSIFVRSHEEKRSAYAPQFGVRVCLPLVSQGVERPCDNSLWPQPFLAKALSERGEAKMGAPCEHKRIHMMSTIKTLLREAEIEESSEVSNDKNNENIETVNDDDGTEVSKHCDSGENVLEEIKDNDLNQPHKRRKGAGDSAIVNNEEQIDVAID
ncbi:ABC transporter G family member [Arachis hypogaea]|nr:ABC transporter G family member [Arachis hypogaea]